MGKKIESKFDYTPSKDESKAMSRCNDNRITIYPVPYGNSYRLTVMRADGHKQVGNESFDSRKSLWCKKIFELYLILETRL